MERIDRHIFSDTTNIQLLEIYKDIIGSKELGIIPTTLRPFAERIKERYSLSTIGEASSFALNYFYEEVALRFFKSIDKDNPSDLGQDSIT